MTRRRKRAFKIASLLAGKAIKKKPELADALETIKDLLNDKPAKSGKKAKR